MNLILSIQNKLLQFLSAAFQSSVPGREASLSRSYEPLIDDLPNQTHRKAKDYHTRHQGRPPIRQSGRISAINQAKTSSGRTLTGQTEQCRPQTCGHSRRNSTGSVIEVIASASSEQLRRSARIK